MLTILLFFGHSTYTDMFANCEEKREEIFRFAVLRRSVFRCYLHNTLNTRPCRVRTPRLNCAAHCRLGSFPCKESFSVLTFVSLFGLRAQQISVRFEKKTRSKYLQQPQVAAVHICVTSTTGYATTLAACLQRPSVLRRIQALLPSNDSNAWVCWPRIHWFASFSKQTCWHPVKNKAGHISNCCSSSLHIYLLPRH